MPLTIPDEVLSAAHLTERAAQIEIACRLFQAGRLTLRFGQGFSRFWGIASPTAK